MRDLPFGSCWSLLCFNTGANEGCFGGDRFSRTDWSELASEEPRQLEDDVTAALRFDYCDEEVDFWLPSGFGSPF